MRLYRKVLMGVMDFVLAWMLLLLYASVRACLIGAPGCRCLRPLALALLGVRGVQAREQNKPGDEWTQGEQRGQELRGRVCVLPKANQQGKQVCQRHCIQSDHASIK